MRQRERERERERGREREREKRERGGVEARPQGAIWCAISPLRLCLFAVYRIIICTCYVTSVSG